MRHAAARVPFGGSRVTATLPFGQRGCGSRNRKYQLLNTSKYVHYKRNYKRCSWDISGTDRYAEGLSAGSCVLLVQF